MSTAHRRRTLIHYVVRFRRARNAILFKPPGLHLVPEHFCNLRTKSTDEFKLAHVMYYGAHLGLPRLHRHDARGVVGRVADFSAKDRRMHDGCSGVNIEGRFEFGS